MFSGSGFSGVCIVVEGLSCPFRVSGRRVSREYLDTNGHMNVAWYISSASDASFSMLEALGIDEGYRARVGASFFTLETQIRYRREVREGSELSFEGRVLDCNGKLLHFLWVHYARAGENGDGENGRGNGEENGRENRDGGASGGEYIAAISEWIYGYVNLRTRRVEEYPRGIGEMLEVQREGCAGLGDVAGVGEGLGLRRK